MPSGLIIIRLEIVPGKSYYYAPYNKAPDCEPFTLDNTA